MKHYPTEKQRKELRRSNVMMAARIFAKNFERDQLTAWDFFSEFTKEIGRIKRIKQIQSEKELLKLKKICQKKRGTDYEIVR
jgi:hypothetical protein